LLSPVASLGTLGETDDADLDFSCIGALEPKGEGEPPGKWLSPLLIEPTCEVEANGGSGWFEDPNGEDDEREVFFSPLKLFHALEAKGVSDLVLSFSRAVEPDDGGDETTDCCDLLSPFDSDFVDGKGDGVVLSFSENVEPSVEDERDDLLDGFCSSFLFDGGEKSSLSPVSSPFLIGWKADKDIVDAVVVESIDENDDDSGSSSLSTCPPTPPSFGGFKSAPDPEDESTVFSPEDPKNFDKALSLSLSLSSMVFPADVLGVDGLRNGEDQLDSAFLF